jgi:regulation of enolase protein 1 (concanavalin A-like superfamily)
MSLFHFSCGRGARSARAMHYLCVFAFFIIASTRLASAGTLPGGWYAANVGSAAVAGSASTLVCSYTTPCLGFSITGVGVDVGGTRDQFTFVYRQLTGDGTIIGRVASLENTDPLIEAGVMVRSSLGADSAHAFAAISEAKGIVFDRRVLTGGATDSSAGGYRPAPVWLRIDRRASSLTAYQSPDGVTWTRIGSQSISLPLTVYVGVAVASHSASLTAKAAVTNVAIVETPLPTGWTSSVIGAPTDPGYSAPSGYSLVVAGAGADIHGVSDQFRYTHTRVSGDVDVSARVASVQFVDAWSKAGVMIRTSLNADASHALMLVSAGRGLAFRRRPAAGYGTLDTSAGSGTAPAWVKLERRGSVVTAFRSADGATWSLVGSQTLDLPSTFYVGLAATSQVPSIAAAAVFDNVVVRAVASALNSPPVVSLTSPSDGAIVAPSTPLSISASASDSDGTIKNVDLYVDGVKIASDSASPYTFTWQSAVVGPHTVKAVAYDDDGASATSALRTVTVRSPTGGLAARYAVFEPSVDHVSVDTYVLEIYTAGTVPGLLTTYNLGKPAVVSGECKVDVTAVVALLPAGSYVAVVRAVNTSGSTSSLPSPAFAR